MLYEVVQEIAQLAEMLADGDITQDIYNDTVQAIGAEVDVEEVIKAIRNESADAEMFKAEAERFTEKRRRAEAKAESLKKLVLDYLKVTEQKKVDTGLFSVSRRASKSCEISDESVIPAEYLIAQQPKVDKKSILAALKDGAEIPGAILRESESIMIK